MSDECKFGEKISNIKEDVLTFIVSYYIRFFFLHLFRTTMYTTYINFNIYNLATLIMCIRIRAGTTYSQKCDQKLYDKVINETCWVTPSMTQVNCLTFDSNS